MKLTSVFIMVGFLIFLYSLMLSPYTDNELFHKKYYELSSDKSEAFYKLRNEMLTPKYRLQDTGITFFSFGLLAALILKVGKGKLRTPKSTSMYIALAIILPVITVGAYVFDLLQGVHREEFPHWSDSLGIPLMGTPILFLALLIWSLMHFIFLKGPELNSKVLVFSKSFNPWLIIQILVTSLFLIICFFYGAYWYAFSGALWLYFYVSLSVHSYEEHGVE